MKNVQLKKLATSDINEFITLITLFEAVFDMENFSIPETSSLQKTLNDENFMAYVALQDGKVIGGLTAYVLAPYYSTSPEVYIYDLAVDPKFQRKGIGRNLIDTMTEYCRSKGIKEVFVQADVSDQQALDFYRSTGGKSERVVHFSYPLSPDQK